MAKRYNLTERIQVGHAATARDLCTRLLKIYAARLKACYADARMAEEREDYASQELWLDAAKSNFGKIGRYRNLHRQCVQRISRFVAAL